MKLLEITADRLNEEILFAMMPDHASPKALSFAFNISFLENKEKKPAKIILGERSPEYGDLKKTILNISGVIFLEEKCHPFTGWFYRSKEKEICEIIVLDEIIVT